MMPEIAEKWSLPFYGNFWNLQLQKHNLLITNYLQ